MNALLANIPQGVASAAAKAAFVLLLTHVDVPRPDECTMDGVYGWTMRPCRRLPATRNRHFTDTGTGYEATPDPIVITCAETLAPGQKDGAAEDHEKQIGNVLKNAKHTYSDFMKSFGNIEWNKVSGSVVEFIKTNMPTEDQAGSALKDAKDKPNHSQCQVGVSPEDGQGLHREKHTNGRPGTQSLCVVEIEIVTQHMNGETPMAVEKELEMVNMEGDVNWW